MPRQNRTLDRVDVLTSLPHLVEPVLLAGRTSYCPYRQKGVP